MAVQITKEFLTNVALFVIAIIAFITLGLSIGTIINPCKDKFGDINCNLVPLRTKDFNTTRKYDLKRSWKGTDLIPQYGKGWTYFESPNWIDPPKGNETFSNTEPTHSMVTYIDGLLGNNFDGSTPDKLVTRVIQKGNALTAVRISTVESFNQGLFIMKVKQIPSGKYVWPSWWLLGSTAKPNAWAMNGEIDIIEGGWNANTVRNTSTLHTQGTTCNKNNKNCFSLPSPTTPNTCGTDSSQPCPFNGCEKQFDNTNSFGKAFKGGFFALELKKAGSIRIWMFLDGHQPKNLNDNATRIDTSNWPKTNSEGVEYIDFSADNCKDTFDKMHIIINTAVGGDAFPDPKHVVPGGRLKKPTYDEAVNSIKLAGDDANWIINYVKVFQ